MPEPLWRIETVKQLNNEVWSNDWLTDDATIDDAQDLAAILQTFERNIHMSAVQFTYIRVSSYIPGDRTFRNLQTNLPGLNDTLDYLPLFNTVRLNLQTADSDPGRKYFRCPVPELQQTNGVLVPSYITFLSTQVATYLVAENALEHLVTPKGNRVTSATIFPNVQMRQLHRRRKKKVTP